MATLHISEAEAARDFAGLIAKVRAGVEVLIEGEAASGIVMHTAEPPRRTLAECIARLPEASTGVIDEDFARDVDASIESHREPLEASVWD